MPRPNQRAKSIQVAGGKIFSLKDLASESGITVRSLQEYIKSGELRAKKVAGSWMVTDQALAEFYGVAQQEA